MAIAKEFTKGLWKEIPPFRLVLGLCPVLAVTKYAENGLGMGLAATFALVAVLPNQTIDTRWAFIPAGILFILGFALFAPLQSVMSIVWPLALVGLGIYIMIRTLK